MLIAGFTKTRRTFRTLFRIWPLAFLVALFTGCHSVRQAEAPEGPHFGILTYNINWGAPGPQATAIIIRESGAEIVCLQETTPEWEHYLRANLASEYPFMEFRLSEGRMGGGLAFLSKTPGNEVAYVPSNTGWFDGWIMSFNTAEGPVQVLNVHLKPAVSDAGSFTPSAYFSTRDDRLKEIQRFFDSRRPDLPTLVVGDFNDTEKSAALKWLKAQGLANSLPEFDHRSPTWEWKVSFITLHRRMDHILYSSQLHCCAAAVAHVGESDHFPVTAMFEARR